MSDDLTAQAAAFLADARWKVEKFEDFRASHGFQQVTRKLTQVPVELLQYAFENLKAATYDTLLVNGKELTGPWRQAVTWWEERPQREDETGRPVGNPGMTQLVLLQMLTDQPTAGEAYVVENGCAYQVTQKFYWAVAALPAVPASTSGTAYTLDGVSKSRDTGLYSCVLNCRVRQLQTVPIYTASLDKFNQVEKQIFQGVVDGTTPAGILTPGAPGGGVLVAQEVSKNADCTTNIEQRKKTAVQALAFMVRQVKTLFATSVSTDDKNATAPLGVPPVAAAGVTTENTDTQNEDGTYDRKQTVKTAVQALAYMVRRVKTLFETVTITDDHAATAPLGVPADPAEGVTTENTDTQNDDGTYERKQTQTAELNVTDAEVVKRLTVYESSVSTTNRSQAAAAADPVNPGDVVRNSKTPGAAVTQEITNRTPIAVAVAETMAVVSPLMTETVSGAEGQAAALATPAAVVGQVLAVTSKLGDLGKWSTSARTNAATFVEVYQTFTADNHIVQQWQMRNATETQIETHVATVATSVWSVQVSKRINEYGLLDADVHARSVDATSNFFYSAITGTFIDVAYHQFKGRMFLVRTTYTYDVEKGIGVVLGRAHYNGTSGPSPGVTPLTKSVFRELGKDWYYYMKVKSISTVTSDVTAAWIAGTAITTP
jgi:hypothetical protein